MKLRNVLRQSIRIMCSVWSEKGGEKDERYISTVEFTHVSIKTHNTSVTLLTLKMRTGKRCRSNSGRTSPLQRHNTGPVLSGLNSGRTAVRTICSVYRHRPSVTWPTARNSLLSPYVNDNTGVSVGFGSTSQLLIIRSSLYVSGTSDKWKYSVAVRQMFIDLNL